MVVNVVLMALIQKLDNVNQRLFTLPPVVAKRPRAGKTSRFLDGLKKKPSSRNQAVSAVTLQKITSS